ncbi:MAG: glutathione peroxidase, partial [Bacteroidetes bacterium]|nr:glutathione peroxidase [Bacteroidota bacterium]
MRILILIFIIIFQQGTLMAQTLYDFTIQDVDGKVINLKDFEGKP